MASTFLYPLTKIENGQQLADVVVTTPGDAICLRMATQALGGFPESTVIMSIRDSSGRNISRLTCLNGQAKRLTLEDLPADGVVVTIQCLFGGALVSLEQLTDLDATLPEGDAAADSVTALEEDVEELQTPAGVATITSTMGAASIDMSAVRQRTFYIELVEDVVLAVSGMQDSEKLTILVQQDVGGTNAFTIDESIAWEGGNAPTVTQTGDAMDIYTLQWFEDQGLWVGAVIQDMQLP